MQSLNAQFKQAIVENLYNYSNFDGKQYPLEDLQICHILSKSKRTKNAIKKAYNCNDKTAEIIMNMPLLNTVVGSREQNKAYCKTEDITFIDYKIVSILYDIIWEHLKLLDISNLHHTKLYNFHSSIMTIISLYKDKQNDTNITSYIKEAQYQFHKEIDLHF